MRQSMIYALTAVSDQGWIDGHNDNRAFRDALALLEAGAPEDAVLRASARRRAMEVYRELALYLEGKTDSDLAYAIAKNEDSHQWRGRGDMIALVKAYVTHWSDGLLHRIRSSGGY